MEEIALMSDNDYYDRENIYNFRSKYPNYNMNDDSNLFGHERRRMNRCEFYFKYICRFPTRCWDSCINKCKRKKEYFARNVYIGKPLRLQKYPTNALNNQKYNVFSFIPKVLFEQFSVFLNFVFLVMAISQFIPALKIGYLYTYWGPLIFVILVTMCREAYDDFRRWQRDREVNSTKYTKLLKSGEYKLIASSKVEIGDILIIEKNQRVPADMILLQTTEKQGTCYIKTDQLDGETDWKLRIAAPMTQVLGTPEAILQIQAVLFIEKPNKSIHTFDGSMTRTDVPQDYNESESSNKSCYFENSLSVENTLWSNTVLANGRAVGIVVYTGEETRSVMNSSSPRSKWGLIDREVNNLTKLLFVTTLILSFVMLVLKGFTGSWYKYYWRYFLLFSYIIPLALRVNLDVSKIVAAFIIMRDKEIPGVIVRSTTIPEELGRISYLMSDKTGTLTRNEMNFKKLHLGTVSYGTDSMEEVRNSLNQAIFEYTNTSSKLSSDGATKFRKSGASKVLDAVLAIALCHNVTPVTEQDEDSDAGDPAAKKNKGPEALSLTSVKGDSNEAYDSTQMHPIEQKMSYQASSPDEIALVQWTETIGLTLIYRDLSTMQLRSEVHNKILHYDILEIFPFTSERKRMGILIRDKQTGEIIFFMKGADNVMSNIVTFQDWLEEETGNMAREGLRTLVVGKKILSQEEYNAFVESYHQAKMSTSDRNVKIAGVLSKLETQLELLCLTGVEDKLQENVRPTLETLRNAGIRVWMLTGDKLETAECIAKSSRLVGRNQTLHIFQTVCGRAEAHLELNSFRKRQDSALIIDGNSLQTCLEYYEYEFMQLAIMCPAVVVCRCSPTQKAAIVRLLREHTGKRIASIGDGGNDVSMIQAADVGVGIVGKEGRQASLASDFSLLQFSHVTKLMLVHGRNTYKNTAALAQFIIHRGTIISVMQAIFSAIFYFVAIPLFPGFLMVGYATLFTMFPVFSLVLDKDVTDKVALTYPELYKTLIKGRDLNFKTFFVWVLISIYQGGIIMYGALVLFEDDFVHVVSITFTSLIITELLMVALTIRTWHLLMVIAEVFSIAIYILALVILKDYFDKDFLKTINFIWKVAAITAVSCIPLFILKYIRYKLRPPIHTKLQD